MKLFKSYSLRFFSGGKFALNSLRRALMTPVETASLKPTVLVSGDKENRKYFNYFLVTFNYKYNDKINVCIPLSSTFLSKKY